MMRCAAAALLALSCTAAAAELTKQQQLEKELQGFLDSLAKKYPYAMQLAWKSEDMEFALAAGGWDEPGVGKRATKTTDRFLFGSGTKPVTATAVVQLAEEGKLSLDDLLYPIIDPVLQEMNGTTLAGLFGEEANQITVRHVLSMQSGVQDFDWPDYDKEILDEGFRVHPPIEFVTHAAAHPQKLICSPGTCVCYSSTNYILAGLILQAYSGLPLGAWQQLNTSTLLPRRAADDLCDAKFFTDESLDVYQSVGGISGMANDDAANGANTTNTTLVYHQNSSILGFTCGNMAAPASNMARFMWDLVGKGKGLVSPRYQKEMEVFKPLSKGWAVGRIQYGVGLMVQAVSLNATYPPQLNESAAYIGHGGDTYGFLSEQGYYPFLNASVAVIVNEDNAGYFAQLVMACNMLRIAAPIVRGEEAGVKCVPY